MSSRELGEWIAMESIEPLPNPYWIGAQQCLVAASAAGSKRLKLEDFLPLPPVKQQGEALDADASVAAVGGLLGVA